MTRASATTRTPSSTIGLRAAGYRIWMTDKTFMIYYPRASVSGLFRQYLGYGRGRARNILKHRAMPKIRQMIPLLVLPVVVGASLAFLSLCRPDTGRPVDGRLHRLRRLDGGRSAQSLRPAGRRFGDGHASGVVDGLLAAASGFPQTRGKDVMTAARQDTERNIPIDIVRLHLSPAGTGSDAALARRAGQCRRCAVVGSSLPTTTSCRARAIWSMRCRCRVCRSKSSTFIVPASNISIARNACLDNSNGDFLAFIDDDETASDGMAGRTARRGAKRPAPMPCSGRCRPFTRDDAPGWMRRGDFHSTLPVWVDGEIRTGYTCNVLLRRASPRIAGRRFNLASGRTGGEDTEYFAANASRPAAASPTRRGRWSIEPVPATRVRAFHGWPGAASAAARPMAGCLADSGQLRPCAAQIGLAAAKAAYCFAACGRHWRPRRSTATAMRCAASCMSASSSGCSASREIRHYGDGTAAGEARQCSLT